MPLTYGVLCALAEKHNVTITENMRAFVREVEAEDLRAQPVRLAAEHKGMRVDYRGLLQQTREVLRNDPSLAEMLLQLQGHLTELGRRWYAGDTAAVDELLQLYCVESDMRASLASAATHGATQLPARDVTKPAGQQGMFRKFTVCRVDGRDLPGGDRHGAEYFVLDLTHDRHTRNALLAYAASCKREYPALARDLMTKATAMPADEWQDHAYHGDPEREWNEFWADICAPAGVPDITQIKLELSDLSMLLHHVPRVYSHVTGGLISIPTTLPDVVCSVHDGHVQDLCEDAVKEAQGEASQQHGEPTGDELAKVRATLMQLAQLCNARGFDLIENSNAQKFWYANRDDAHAAVDSLDEFVAAQSGPLAGVAEGWPTDAMIEAGRKSAESHGALLGNGQSLWHIFRDMLAAAPTQQEVAR